MPKFHSRGHTGAATRTIWLNYVADNYTMLLKVQDLNGDPYQGVINSDTEIVPCLYANKFNIVNASFGAFIAAPNGNMTTCQKIVENSSNVEHYVQGAWGSVFQGLWPAFRIAGIWKAGERTRICYQMTAQSALTDTLSLGFDLSGAQVAYQTFSSVGVQDYFEIQDQTITPLGNGFYLCIADVLGLSTTAAGIASGWNFRFLLDNGSGTAAKSTTYTGDGASGLYGWKNSVLPKRAWNIAGLAFADEFDDPTMANIDLDNTQADGFDWYVAAGGWSGTLAGSGHYAAPPVDPAFLSVAGSVLTIGEIPAPSIGVPGGITTFCAPGGGLPTITPPMPPGINPTGPGVGKGWKPPHMTEVRFAYDYAQQHTKSANHFAYYSIEWKNWAVQNVPYDPGNALAAKASGGEWDNTDIAALGQHTPSCGAGVYLQNIGSKWVNTTGQSVAGGTISTSYGYPEFFLGHLYAGGNVVLQPDDGIYYQCIVGNTLNEPPHADWSVFDYPADVTSQNRFPKVHTDFSEFHTYTQIVVPYDRDTHDRGCVLWFFDSCLRRGVSWTAQPSPGSDIHTIKTMHAWDWHTNYFELTAVTAADMCEARYDYVRIHQ